MTTTKITRSGPIGLKLIRKREERFDTVAVWGKKGIELFDIYINGEWHGSRLTMENCLHYYYQHVTKKRYEK